MRKLFYAACVAAMCVSACQRYDFNDDGTVTNGEEVVERKTKDFFFHVKGEFMTDYEDMTRAAVRLEESNAAGVTDLWVLDYDSLGVLLQKVHQSANEESFGTVAMTLTYGKHNIKFVASKGENPTLTTTGDAPSLAWTKVKDTFVLDYPIDVKTSSNGNRAPELKRAITGIKIVMTDAVPSDAKDVIIEMKRSLSLSLPGLTAAPLSVSDMQLTFPASYYGQKGMAMMAYTLCPTDEFTTDVKVTVLDANGNAMSEFTVEGVSLKKNRMTTLTGEVFNRTSGFSVAIDDTWDAELSVEF